MKVHGGRTIEGALLLPRLVGGGAPQRWLEPMMTYPYMAAAERCDGCGECVEQCPTGALGLVWSGTVNAGRESPDAATDRAIISNDNLMGASS